MISEFLIEYGVLQTNIAVAIKVIEPVFESQTKTKLGSNEIEPNGKSVKAFILEFLQKELAVAGVLEKDRLVLKTMLNSAKVNEKIEL